jgi:hypothetical protein
MTFAVAFSPAVAGRQINVADVGKTESSCAEAYAPVAISAMMQPMIFS